VAALAWEKIPTIPRRRVRRKGKKKR